MRRRTPARTRLGREQGDGGARRGDRRAPRFPRSRFSGEAVVEPSLLRLVALGRLSRRRPPVTELRDAAAERAPHLRQPLRPEDEEQHAEEHEQFPYAGSERDGYARNGLTALVA